MAKEIQAKILESLKAKGVIIAGKPIEHTELVNDKERLYSLSSPERDYLHYLREREEIQSLYQESKDWVEVFSKSVYLDVKQSQEAFIDLSLIHI